MNNSPGIFELERLADESLELAESETQRTYELFAAGEITFEELRRRYIILRSRTLVILDLANVLKIREAAKGGVSS